MPQMAFATVFVTSTEATADITISGGDITHTFSSRAASANVPEVLAPVMHVTRMSNANGSILWSIVLASESVVPWTITSLAGPVSPVTRNVVTETLTLTELSRAAARLAAMASELASKSR